VDTACRRPKRVRLYDCPRIALLWVVEGSFERWVLIRRNRRDPQHRAYYLVFAPKGTALAELAGAAGLRRTIEECLQRAKEELGLDRCEARSWHGWHRHMTLCMAALALLAGLAAQLRRSAYRTKGVRSPSRHDDSRHTAKRAADPLPVRAAAAHTDRPRSLHTGLVTMQATSGKSRQRPSKASEQIATVVYSMMPSGSAIT
jgi:hypothetical protein